MIRHLLLVGGFCVLWGISGCDALKDGEFVQSREIRESLKHISDRLDDHHAGLPEQGGEREPDRLARRLQQLQTIRADLEQVLGDAQGELERTHAAVMMAQVELLIAEMEKSNAMLAWLGAMSDTPTELMRLKREVNHIAFLDQFAGDIVVTPDPAQPRQSGQAALERALSEVDEEARLALSRRIANLRDKIGVTSERRSLQLRQAADLEEQSLQTTDREQRLALQRRAHAAMLEADQLAADLELQQQGLAQAERSLAEAEERFEAIQGILLAQTPPIRPARTPYRGAFDNVVISRAQRQSETIGALSKLIEEQIQGSYRAFRATSEQIESRLERSGRRLEGLQGAARTLAGGSSDLNAVRLRTMVELAALQADLLAHSRQVRNHLSTLAAWAEEIDGAILGQVGTNIGRWHVEAVSEHNRVGVAAANALQAAQALAGTLPDSPATSPLRLRLELIADRIALDSGV